MALQDGLGAEFAEEEAVAAAGAMQEDGHRKLPGVPSDAGDAEDVDVDGAAAWTSR